MTRDRLLALLRRPLAAHEATAFLAEVAALEARLATLVPRADRVAELARARLAGSMTLRGPAPPELAPWLAANARMAELVAADAPIDLPAIRALNALLRGLPGAPWRAKPIAVGLFPCPPPEDIAPLLAPMLEEVARRSAEVHPIAGAALLEQWLVTVHPFDDGNGRTSRLVSDWALALHGYPPASYASLVGSMKAIVDHGDESITPDGTCRALLDGIRHTVDLVGG